VTGEFNRPVRLKANPHAATRPQSAGLLFALFCSLFSLNLFAAPARVVVLSSNDAPPYAQCAEGISAALKGADIQTVQLAGDAAKAAEAARQLAADKPAVVLTLGKLATDAVLEHAPGVPVVAGLLLDNRLLDKPNVTGVPLDHPAATELQWLHRLLPEAAQVGVIFDPARDAERVERLRAAAKPLGLTIVAEAVKEAGELPGALERLSRHAQVILGIPNPELFSPRTARPVLLFSFRNRLPFVGMTSAWAKAGAIYALDWDYADMGAQLGEMAARILDGTAASKIELQFPRKVRYAINLKTAGHMRVDIPPPWREQAAETFE
jgi:putative ABC transport system substrate-binding protein